MSIHYRTKDGKADYTFNFERQHTARGAPASPGNLATAAATTAPIPPTA